jgi:predicted metal-dependent peptidase
MKITISEAFTYLLEEKHFYTAVANALQRVPAPGFGTIGVGVQNGRLVFVYDPAFVARLSLPAFIWFLEHEMIHLAMDHISRYHVLLSELRRAEDRDRADRVYKIAADCAANELIRGSPNFLVAHSEMRAFILDRKRANDPGAVLHDHDGLILPDLFGLPRGRSFEFYQFELMQRGAFDLDVMNTAASDGVAASHGRWLPSTEESSFRAPLTPSELMGLAEQLRAQTKQLLRRVLGDFGREPGLIPAELVEWLGDYLAEPITPWWEILTTRIQASRRWKVQRGIERPNRSLMAMADEDPTIIATIGLTQDPSYRVFFVEDTSGSMDAVSLRIGLSELEHLTRADDDIEVRFLQGDAAVTLDQVLHAGEVVPREVAGRGGTDFEAYFAHIARYLESDETAPDLLVVFTDGCASVVRPELRLPAEIPVIWLLTERHRATHLKASGYGEVIVCNRDQNRMWQYRE